MAVEVDWDERALNSYLHTMEAEHLPELAQEVEHLARTLAPVRIRRTAIPRWAKHGRIGTPGRLKASVMSDVGEDLIGPYADIGSLWYGRFMDPKAAQLHHLIPFLPSALEWTIDGRVYHW